MNRVTQTPTLSALTRGPGGMMQWLYFDGLNYSVFSMLIPNAKSWARRHGVAIVDVVFKAPR